MHCFVMGSGWCLLLFTKYSFTCFFSAIKHLNDLIDAPICVQSILKFYNFIGGAHQPNPTQPNQTTRV